MRYWTYGSFYTFFFPNAFPPLDLMSGLYCHKKRAKMENCYFSMTYRPLLITVLYRIPTLLQFLEQQLTERN